jgi:hypothetical protein
MPSFTDTPYRSHVHRTPVVPERRTVTLRRTPSHQEIADLAYSHWEARGKPHGSPAEDWLRAERDLRQRYSW